jgi:hypothetical protein
MVTRGCFAGSIESFKQQVVEKHGADSKIGRHYLCLCEAIAIWFDIPTNGETK